MDLGEGSSLYAVGSLEFFEDTLWQFPDRRRLCLRLVGILLSPFCSNSSPAVGSASGSLGFFCRRFVAIPHLPSALPPVRWDSLVAVLWSKPHRIQCRQTQSRLRRPVPPALLSLITFFEHFCILRFAAGRDTTTGGETAGSLEIRRRLGAYPYFGLFVKSV